MTDDFVTIKLIQWEWRKFDYGDGIALGWPTPHTLIPLNCTERPDIETVQIIIASVASKECEETGLPMAITAFYQDCILTSFDLMDTQEIKR